MRVLAHSRLLGSIPFGRLPFGRLPFGRLPADWRFAVGLVVLGLVVLGGEALGCPNCKDGVNVSDPEGLNLARGYFYSILIMLAMPFTLAGSFGCYVWREMRRQELERAADEGGGSVES